MIIPKSYKDILTAMFSSVVNSTKIEDLHSGSVVAAFIECSTKLRHAKLLNLLSKLDSRFKKYLSTDR